MNKQPIVYGFALKRSIKNTKITFAVLLLFILQGIVGNAVQGASIYPCAGKENIDISKK